MNPTGRFARGAFEYSAIYYVLSRALWPGDRSAVAAIPWALLWGVIMEVLVMRRETSNGLTERPPTRANYWYTGLVGLSACVACWAGVVFDPARAQLVSGIALGTWVLSACVVVVRRWWAHSVPAGA